MSQPLNPNFPFDNDFFNQFNAILAETSSNTLDNVSYVIGMMSGTSLDALDAVICQFYDDENEPLELIASHSIDFPEDLREALLALSQPNGVSTFIDKYQLALQSELDVFGWASVFYAEFASQVVIELLEKSGIQAHEVSAIGCHGQTVRHRPQWSFSLQLLDPNVLAERTGIAVVSDFRRRDMAVGGQGAPLVPAFHQAIFGRNNQQLRVIVNLGGIANITVLPVANDVDNVIGFDTGPANLLLDSWCQRHTENNFDNQGNWARSGQVIEPLLAMLLTHPYFSLSAPKSTGREDFHLDWVDNILEKLNHEFPNLRYSSADVQATLTELTAYTVGKTIVNFAKQGEVFVCGGGAFNHYLLERLQNYLPEWTVNTTEVCHLSPRWVEAVAFAWLARQTLLNEPSNLPAVTGARKKVVLGQLCF